jgi:hypothetical protein
MARTIRRLAHARQLVERTVRRDLRRRKVHSADSSLRLRSASLRVVFDAPPPHFTRELPALDASLQTPREYREALETQIARLLERHQVPFLPHRALSRSEITFGVRDEDWISMLHALRVSDLELLYGGSARRAHPSRPLYLDHVDLDAFSTSRCLYLLRPAAVRHDGEVIKRFGFDCAVRIERWSAGAPDGPDADTWAPRLGSPRTGRIAAAAFSPQLEPSAEVLEAREPVAAPNLMEVDFPIDVVYTWVDGTDPEWLARKRAALDSLADEPMSDEAASDLRFVAHDELRYSLRSLEMYAPWVRHVYIVTDRQRPSWLREDDPWISIVDHRDIAPEGSTLPTFNSQAIEANLHRIDGLSEHFLYFNDDVFLSSPVAPELFFGPNGIASMYLSKAQVANGELVLGEPASDSAGKNARELVAEVCGRRVSRKLFHTPFPLRRSISHEIEERWPEVIRRTRDSRFRRLEDVTLSGALHMNYAYATARAVTRSIRYRYVNVGSADAAQRLESLIKDRHVLQTFCLNEASQDLSPAQVDDLVRSFLRRRFPDLGAFEIPGR